MYKSIKKITLVSFLIVTLIVGEDIKLHPETKYAIAHFFNVETTPEMVATTEVEIDEADEVETSNKEFKLPFFMANSSNEIENYIEYAPSKETPLQSIQSMQSMLAYTDNSNIENGFSSSGGDISKEHGPSNNYNNSYASNNVVSNAVSSAINSNNSSTTTGMAATNSPQNIVAVAGLPGPPGGGGGADPLATPLDDYYGILLLLFISSIIGIRRMKQTRLVEKG